MPCHNLSCKLKQNLLHRSFSVMRIRASDLFASVTRGQGEDTTRENNTSLAAKIISWMIASLNGNARTTDRDFVTAIYEGAAAASSSNRRWFINRDKGITDDSREREIKSVSLSLNWSIERERRIINLTNMEWFPYTGVKSNERRQSIDEQLALIPKEIDESIQLCLVSREREREIWRTKNF